MNRSTQPPAFVSRWRLRTVFGLLLFTWAVLVAKAGHLQLSLGDDLKNLAEKQYVRKLKVAAPRGNIYDRNGLPLAVSVPATSVYAAPRDIEDPAAVAAQVAPILGKNQRKLESRLDSERAFIWLGRRISPETAKKLQAEKPDGIGFRKESRRYYPNRELAGQILGLVSIDDEGLSGIEAAYDEYLRGRSILVPGLRDNKGRRVVVAEGVDLDILEGDDIHLTIDARLQHLTERVLREAVLEHKAKSAFAIVMEPKTGAIRALANVPLFNPNSPALTPQKARRNHALSDGVEPGSVFKMVTFAAALDQGVLKSTDRIFCEDGRFAIGKHVIRDAHKAGWLSAAEVFSHSSNIGTIKIAQRLGEKKFRHYIEAFGFGAKPGLGLVGESRGRLPKQERWGDVRTATISFGHGLLVSPLQMASAVSTVANGGLRVRPRIMERITSPTGEVVKTSSSDDSTRIISAEAAHVLTEIMSGVVEEGGTGTLAAIRGVRVAGKTGTAEKVDPVTRRYSRQLHLASFVGFAPAENPEVAVIVMVDEPKGKTVFGGTVAGPAWRTIVEAALIDAGILTANADLAAFALQSESSSTTEAQVRETWAKLKNKSPVATRGATGEGEQIGADTSLKENVAKLGEVRQSSEPLRLLGLTAREALVKSEARGVELALEGSGIVIAQEPGADEPVQNGTRIRIRLGEGS